MGALDMGLSEDISTHTLRKEGDCDETDPVILWTISTHTLRKEGDQFDARDTRPVIHFNPHPPQGG